MQSKRTQPHAGRHLKNAPGQFADAAVAESARSATAASTTGRFAGCFICYPFQLSMWCGARLLLPAARVYVYSERLGADALIKAASCEELACLDEAKQPAKSISS